MKALVKYELGALNVKVMEVEKPKISPDEVLIKVMGAGDLWDGPSHTDRQQLSGQTARHTGARKYPA